MGAAASPASEAFMQTATAQAHLGDGGLLQCVKVAGEHVEWEGGGNRAVQIANEPCSVAFEWGDEGSLRVELSNGKAPSQNGVTEAAPHQELPHQVQRLVTARHSAYFLSAGL